MGSTVAPDFSSARWGSEAPALGMGRPEVSSTHSLSCVGFFYFQNSAFPKAFLDASQKRGPSAPHHLKPHLFALTSSCYLVYMLCFSLRM